MDDAGPASIILKLFLLFILILINAFFAMSEIAIISLNDAKMEKMAEDGDKKAKQVLKLTKNSSNFLSTIQIGVTLAGFLTSAVAAQNFAVMLTDALAKGNSGRCDKRNFDYTYNACYVLFFTRSRRACTQKVRYAEV